MIESVPPHPAQRQALARRRHAQALDRRREARRRAAVPQDHRLKRPRQARHRDRTTPRPPNRRAPDTEHRHPVRRRARHRLTITIPLGSPSTTLWATSRHTRANGGEGRCGDEDELNTRLWLTSCLELAARTWTGQAPRDKPSEGQGRRRPVGPDSLVCVKSRRRRTLEGKELLASLHSDRWLTRIAGGRASGATLRLPRSAVKSSRERPTSGGTGSP